MRELKHMVWKETVYHVSKVDIGYTRIKQKYEKKQKLLSDRWKNKQLLSDYWKTARKRKKRKKHKQLQIFLRYMQTQRIFLKQ